MKNTILAWITALQLSTWVVNADESFKILELKPNCSAVLNQEINWKLLDIITCTDQESFDSKSHILSSTTITNWALIQKIWKRLFPDLDVNEEVQIPLEWFPWITLWKSQDENGEYYYSSTHWYTQLQESQWFDCYRGSDYLTGSQLMMCSDIDKINEEYKKFGFKEKWSIKFSNGEKIYFYDGGGIWIILKENVRI